MKATVITLFRSESGEYYTGVIQGSLTPGQQTAIANRFNLSPREDEPDDISFAEVEICESPDNLGALININSSGSTSGKPPGPGSPRGSILGLPIENPDHTIGD